MRAIRAAALDRFRGQGLFRRAARRCRRRRRRRQGHDLSLLSNPRRTCSKPSSPITIGATLGQVEQAVAASPAPASEILRLMGRAMAMGRAGPRPPARRASGAVRGRAFSRDRRFLPSRDHFARHARWFAPSSPRACASGEFVSDEPARFPQLVIAPALVAAIWSVVFARIEPLDAQRHDRGACRPSAARPDAEARHEKPAQAGRRRIVVLLVIGWAASKIFAPTRPQDVFSGYVEGDLVQIGPIEGERLAKLNVEPGDAGRQAARSCSPWRRPCSTSSAPRREAKVEQARANLKNLQEALQRPEQIAVLQAAVESRQGGAGAVADRL